MLALPACIAPATAVSFADAGTGDYIRIGDTDVSASLGISQQRELEELLNSDTPLYVEQSVDDGSILTVGPLSEMPDKAIVQHSTCAKTDVCLLPYTAPYASFGFSGKGSKQGNWPNISEYTSGKWTTSLQWLYKGSLVKGAKIKPNTHAYFNGIVTIKRVTIY
ncbi:hypothetical protein F7D09_0578 [Bifidobacterium leontopitheci]|uniref:Uncharacterized protein n=2 Tax=Bifidobacterium leontopitheci TaxID=2650774 RepID=A0A6I1GGP2_9BIFI|nr:hypothetical protein F7D09_0578 [Bifidobacterium leontopitheci]